MGSEAPELYRYACEENHKLGEAIWKATKGCDLPAGFMSAGVIFRDSKGEWHWVGTLVPADALNLAEDWCAALGRSAIHSYSVAEGLVPEDSDDYYELTWENGRPVWTKIDAGTG